MWLIFGKISKPLIEFQGAKGLFCILNCFHRDVEIEFPCSKVYIIKVVGLLSLDIYMHHPGSGCIYHPYKFPCPSSNPSLPFARQESIDWLSVTVELFAISKVFY